MPNAISDLSYSDLVDQVQQNNAFSAEQAKQQMDFQREMYERSLNFNEWQAQIDRSFQQESADRAMAFSSAEAQANRDWQAEMSNTAHQREMADLKAAGLNPILAANNGASTGAGATALSAQAAGYGASSPGAPSGAKADADKNGTAAIASLLGKMLDNQVEREKMNVSAETARETADMYTAATRYAAELAMIANQYSADRHLEGTQYASDSSYASNTYAADRHYEGAQYAADTSYESYMNNPLNVLGHELGEFVNGLGENGNSAYNVGVSAKSLGSLANKLGQSLKGKADSIARTLQYIDTGGSGQKDQTFWQKYNPFKIIKSALRK